jgi:CDP-diacylglycerol--serine O-phosphatidyltransferase
VVAWLWFLFQILTLHYHFPLFALGFFLIFLMVFLQENIMYPDHWVCNESNCTPNGPDTLADMVTSGVVTGFVMFKLMQDSAAFGGESYIPFLGFIITLGACYRLAKFNIDERQSDSFIGLPTPANALFFTSLPLINASFFDDNFNGVIYNNWVLIGLCFLSAYIMNAEIPLFSLKIKDFSFPKYKLQISFITLSVLMLFFFQILAVPLIIIVYVLLSVINNIINKKSAE